ncbi:MAG: amidohydrolase, partial [Clostridiales bacterium]
MLIIRNAIVNTISGEAIENGFVAVNDGKILKTGGMPVPEELLKGAELLDAKGMQLYPGFID